jgi:DNA polymerase-1
MKTLYLVDASIYIFRAYYSLPGSMTGTDGKPVNAVYGFAEFLHQLKSGSKGEYFFIAFDESLTTSFRNEFYPAYKANRELPPPELEAQLKACRELAEILGFKTRASERYEADDLIGTAAKQMRRNSFRMNYVTGDKDLAQLVKPGDTWWNFARGEKLTSSKIKQKLGVHAEQVVDLLALMGDAADNIPGVPGIGQKTAVSLLDHLKSLDQIYAELDCVSHLPLRGAQRAQQQLEQYRDQAYLSQELARINENAPIRCTEASIKKQSVKPKRLQAFCSRHRFSDRMYQRLLSV